MKNKVGILGTGTMFVGSIVTPAAGAPPTIGNSDGGSGAQIGMIYKYNMASFSAVTNPTFGTVGQQGTGTVTNPANILDGDLSTFTTLTVVANGALNSAGIVCFGPPGISASAFQAVKVVITVAVTVNSVSPNTPPLGGDLVSIHVGSAGPDFSGSAIVTSIPTTNGATFTLQEIEVLLPRNANLSQIGVYIQAVTLTSMSSGSITVQIHEVSLQGLV